MACDTPMNGLLLSWRLEELTWKVHRRTQHLHDSEEEVSELHLDPEDCRDSLNVNRLRSTLVGEETIVVLI